MKNLTKNIGNHKGFQIIKQKDKDSVVVNGQGCCSHIKYTGDMTSKWEDLDIEYLIYIPLSYTDKPKEKLIEWCEFITKAGFPCKFNKVTKVPAFNNDLEFYEIEILTKLCVSQHHALAVWTLLRYFYSIEYSYIAQFAMELRKQNPLFFRINCILFAHLYVTLGLNMNYNPYHGLIGAGIPKLYDRDTWKTVINSFKTGVNTTFPGVTITSEQKNKLVGLIKEERYTEAYRYLKQLNE